MTLTAAIAEQRAARQCSERLEIAVRTCKLLGVKADPDVCIRACQLEHHAHVPILRRLVRTIEALG